MLQTGWVWLPYFHTVLHFHLCQWLCVLFFHHWFKHWTEDFRKLFDICCTCFKMSYLVYEKRQRFELLGSVEDAVHDDDRLVSADTNRCQQLQQRQQQQRQGRRWSSAALHLLPGTGDTSGWAGSRRGTADRPHLGLMRSSAVLMTDFMLIIDPFTFSFNLESMWARPSWTLLLYTSVWSVRLFVSWCSF